MSIQKYTSIPHCQPNVSQTDANRDVFEILTITISCFTVLLTQVQLIPP